MLITSAGITIPTLAQSDSTTRIPDSLRSSQLPEVYVNAYNQQSSLLNAPAALNIISNKELGSYSDAGILQAVNSTPGVRMEERSPGSYRFGIRGSALEAPFGVRNVKVYYNEIPLTDPGGTTYLNALGTYSFQSLEIIKGPGSILYGAGTGGVLLINSLPQQWSAGATLTYTGGSYWLSSGEAELRAGDSSFQNTIRYQRLSTDGYRDQSALRRDVASWDAVMRKSAGTSITAHFLYSDMDYQTPGALTLAELNADPRAARPGAGPNPSAADSKAAIDQKLALAGFTVRRQLSQAFSAMATLYGSYTAQLNPNIRNYSRVYSPHFGGRAIVDYKARIGQVKIDWLAGSELQQGFTQASVYQNKQGTPGTLQTDQENDNRQWSGFTQLTAAFGKWILTGSASLNDTRIQLSTFSASPAIAQQVSYQQLAPRLAILYKVQTNLSAYAAVEKGFSPPSTDALAPTGGALNLTLRPETGWNYEGGFRGYALKRRLSFDVSAFYFELTDGIIPRRDSAGGDFYINAGSTRQAGVEAAIRYDLIYTATCTLGLWTSYTGHHLRYNDFRPLENNYSGNILPGAAPNTISAGAALELNKRLMLNVTYFYSDAIYLNDANTAKASPYDLLGSRMSYRFVYRRLTGSFFAGGDNLFDAHYSLGNDINALNGRYYNAAAGRSFYVGASLSFH